MQLTLNAEWDIPGADVPAEGEILTIAGFRASVQAPRDSDDHARWDVRLTQDFGYNPLAEGKADTVEAAKDAAEVAIRHLVKTVPGVTTEESTGPTLKIGDTAHILTISDRNETSGGIYSSAEAATLALAMYVEQSWDAVVGLGGVPDEAPEDNEEAIDIYFESLGDESYTIAPAQFEN